MAIIDAASWQAATGQTVTGADLTALSLICAAVDAAIKQYIRPFVPEPVLIEDRVLDAPLGQSLLLPVVPVRQIDSLYVNYTANGDPDLFTADDLLTEFTDYYLPLDDWLEEYNFSRSGRVLRVGWSSWGADRVNPLGRLGWGYAPARGAVKVTFRAGLPFVPADVQQAAVLAASIMWGRRVTGIPLNSESWNGYSFQASGPFTQVGAIVTPDVAMLLSRYVDPLRLGAL